MIKFVEYYKKEVTNKLLVEISQSLINRSGVEAHNNLEYIFNGKRRIAEKVELVDGDIHEEIEDVLMKSGYDVDLKRWMAKKDNREIDINKALGRLKGNSRAKELGRSKVKPTTMYIIYSRDPVDILRMSDFSHITSCHGTSGSFFNCAVEEARGGCIAYLLDEKNFNDIDHLDDSDIFHDTDRNIYTGVEPISRLKIKTLVDDDGNETPLPDSEVFGRETFYNDFIDSVYEWARNHKNPQFNFNSPKLIYRGGSYEDNLINDNIQLVYGISYDGSIEIDSDIVEVDIADRQDEVKSEIESLTNGNPYMMTYIEFNEDYDNFENPNNFYIDVICMLKKPVNVVLSEEGAEELGDTSSYSFASGSFFGIVDDASSGGDINVRYSVSYDALPEGSFSGGEILDHLYIPRDIGGNLKSYVEYYCEMLDEIFIEYEVEDVEKTF